jgi:hypothetical protein
VTTIAAAASEEKAARQRDPIAVDLVDRGAQAILLGEERLRREGRTRQAEVRHS